MTSSWRWAPTRERRKLPGRTDAFTAAGFRISVISEPQPGPAARGLDSDGLRMLSADPSFPFFVLHAG
jgi:hypothetical protein